MISGDRMLTAVYRVCLYAYPRDFRLAYGAEMAQVFRTSLRTSRAPVRTTATALADLAGSSLRERTVVRPDVRYVLVWLAAALLSFAGGYLHLRSDADTMTAGLVLAGSFLCGAAYPQKALRWGIIVGIGVPLALVVSHGMLAPHRPHDADTFSPLALVPALFGAYAGSLLASVMRMPAAARDRT